MAKKNTDFSASSWDFLSKYLEDVSKQMHDDLNIGLEKATDYLVEELKKETPIKTGDTQKSWVTEKKYRNVKYINNTAVTSKNIPKLNLIEFSKKGKPFVRKTLNSNKEKIDKIISEEVAKTQQQ